MAIAGTAVMRAADAMLRALGGDQIALVLPLPVPATDPGSQLGLSDPGMQRVFISPVIVRNLPGPSTGPRLRLEFLLSASAVANAVDAQGAGSPEVLFDSALGIQYQADLFHIESMTIDYFAGTAYLYHVIAVE
jgi:hypothetical protein